MKTILRRISTRGFQSQQLRAQSTFICSRCRKNRLHPTAQFSSPLFQSSQHRAKSTDEKLPFGEKLRRKIWATDTPPGQKNPYERLTPEQRAKEIEEREAAASEELEYEDEASDQEAKGVPSPVTDGYVQAATWDGLDQIGGSEGWWEEAWDQENQFVGFATGVKSLPSQRNHALRRALIEILTIQETNSPLSDVSKLSIHNHIDHRHVKVVASKQGKFSVQYEDPAIHHDLLNEDENWNKDRGTSAEEMIEVEVPTSNPPEDCRWLQVPIDDLGFKFAYLKRVVQLTGGAIPDPALRTLYTVSDVVKLLTKKPEPTKLAEALLARADLMALPNVEIFPRRHTPIDKEMEVGRWKVIEQELKKRDLPLTGHR